MQLSKVGALIAQKASANNNYARWIKTYASEDFSKSVDEAIGIFNEFAADANSATRDKMAEAFYTSTLFENGVFGMMPIIKLLLIFLEMVYLRTYLHSLKKKCRGTGTYK